MKSIELKENGSIYQILGFDSTQVGLEQLHNRAKLCVQDVDFEDAKIMGKKVRELPSVDVQQKLAEALSGNPFELLARGWGQIRLIREAVAKSRNPAKPELAHLAQHDLEASLEPRLVLTIDGVDWCSVRLSIVLRLRVQAADFVFYDGSLTGVTFGNPVGSVSLKVEGREVAACKRELDISTSPYKPPSIRMPGAQLRGS
ncbi:hypothetical protein LJR290_007709 [Variovorax sp. LjRoot290]|uniref:hypothetical protein n=1 Tax=Variovorax sp. LjRoot290 TaxID=3342316 RepID=UPI003ECE668B